VKQFFLERFQMTDSDPRIVALVRDLMFSGRISAEARAAGVPIQMLRDSGKLAQSGVVGARLLIVDLNLDGAITAAAAWRAAGAGRVVGFVSHVDTQTIEEARNAGIDQVLARSAFVKLLPDLLTSMGEDAKPI
jgi:hypothetical protein